MSMVKPISDRKVSMERRKTTAIIYAFLAAVFYAINLPVSKVLLQEVGPTTMAALLYLGAGIGIGLATGKAVDAVARQPESHSKIMTLLLLGCALAEATAIYGLLVAILIIFVL